MKRYKGYELMQAVIEGKLNLQQRVNSIGAYYNDCTIGFVLKDAARNIMDLDFEVIEKKRKISEIPYGIYLKLRKNRYDLENILNGIRTDLQIHQDKINELILVVNEEREEK